MLAACSRVQSRAKTFNWIGKNDPRRIRRARKREGRGRAARAGVRRGQLPAPQPAHKPRRPGPATAREPRRTQIRGQRSQAEQQGMRTMRRRAEDGSRTAALRRVHVAMMSALAAAAEGQTQVFAPRHQRGQGRQPEKKNQRNGQSATHKTKGRTKPNV